MTRRLPAPAIIKCGTTMPASFTEIPYQRED